MEARRSYVYFSCQKQWLPLTSQDKFLNISEGPQGEDTETFTCHFCKEDHTSIVRGDR